MARQDALLNTQGCSGLTTVRDGRIKDGAVDLRGRDSPSEGYLR